MALLDDAPSKTPGLLCPSCRVDLVMTERQGIEIDYCPKCRGVWLDRGELDKIVERSSERAERPEGRDRPTRDNDRYEQRGSDHRNHGHESRHSHRRRSWLSDLFD